MPQRDPEKKKAYQKAWFVAHPHYQRDYTRKWTRVRFAENMAEIRKLKDVPCADCGNRFPLVCMDFDHKQEDKPLSAKKHSLSTRARSNNQEKLLEELRACTVVCANCHRIRSSEQRKANGRPDYTNP